MKNPQCEKLENDIAVLRAVKQQFDNNLEGHTIVGDLDLLRKNISNQIFWLGKGLRIARVDTDKFESKIAKERAMRAAKYVAGK
ncbi:hypothetical protein HON36_04520 [Candidatus Parcubacteria bacterium]|jgi:hypothetical protein|nr:hypothetical protein [Candidatus Parcubacteria bacterium]MBT7227983.1 hypothetical protein [Candidatus Parcubacteria bacterium]